jgi:hypothetical protein
MSTLYITEFKALKIGGLQVAAQPPLAEQTVAITAGSVQSAAFSANTGLVRIETDSICSVLFGANPTATTSSARMGAGDVEYFAVTPGTKVAVIANV